MAAASSFFSFSWYVSYTACPPLVFSRILEGLEALAAADLKQKHETRRNEEGKGVKKGEEKLLTQKCGRCRTATCCHSLHFTARGTHCTWRRGACFRFSWISFSFASVETNSSTVKKKCCQAERRLSLHQQVLELLARGHPNHSGCCGCDSSLELPTDANSHHSHHSHQATKI